MNETEITFTDLLDYAHNLDLIDSRELWDERDSMAADVRAELDALDAEVSSYAGDSMEDGITFIRASYFETYAQELAEVCGMIPDTLEWPIRCIDWKQAARELEQDYTSVKIGNIWYYYR